MGLRQPRTILGALYRLYQHSGFSMAGAVAFSVLLSLFPFFIFLGALASVVGGRDLADSAVDLLFQQLPKPVAEGLAGEVEAVVGQTRIDLLTLSAGIALFFATSAIETLRAALNASYRVQETRPYPLCLLVSALFVFVSAILTLVLTWAFVSGSQLATGFAPWATKLFLTDQGLTASIARYAIAALVIGFQLVAYHLWLAAGRRRLSDVWPGVLLSLVLYIIAVASYSSYLNFSDYTRFYAGLSQLMVALIFFQVIAVIVLLGAELNRGLIELRRLGPG
jgi:membrane protein